MQSRNGGGELPFTRSPAGDIVRMRPANPQRFSRSALRASMPTRVNGIGTGYYGKSNLQTFEAVCEHCHRTTKLRNYETRLWFSIFFIPVIPLARKQILSQCPICTWHRAVPFA